MLHNASSLRRAMEHAPILPTVRERDTLGRARQPTLRKEPILPTTACVDAAPARRTPAPVVPQRRRLHMLLITLGILVAVAGGLLAIKLLDPATLPITSVRIEGRFTHVTAVELQQKLAAVTSGNFLRVDVDAIRQTALALPWVNSVSVQRVWPDTLRVSITEHLAAATWAETADGQALGLLNASGTLFTPEHSSYPEGLPTLLGPHGAHTTLLGHYQAMNQTLLPLGLRIKRLAQDNRRAFSLTLDNGIELALGRSDSYARLMRFVRAWPSLQNSTVQPVSIDLRYSNGLAVRWPQQESGKNTAAMGRDS